MPEVIQNCFAKCGFRAARSVNADDEDKNCKWVELQGHADCNHDFNKLLNVDKSVCSTGDQPTDLDSPLSSSVHVTSTVRGEDRENTAASHPILPQRCSNGVMSAGSGKK
jgi:hypothetical protein